MKDCLNTFNSHAAALTNLYDFIANEFQPFSCRLNPGFLEIFSPLFAYKSQGRDSGGILNPFSLRELAQKNTHGVCFACITLINKT